MSFRPTRTSPPSKLTDSLLASTLSADASRSSAVPVPELQGLTNEEVDVLDAIVERAGPSATTFPAIFTAYNAILEERGLDSSEVVYYGKLLKLGTLKGTWEEKWRVVKAQQGRAPASRASHAPTRPTTRNAALRPTRANHKASHNVDSLTVHTLDNQSTKMSFEDDDERLSLDVPQYHLPNRQAARPASPGYSDVTSLASQNIPVFGAPYRSQPLHSPRIRADASSSVATEHRGAPSTTLLSYRPAAREISSTKTIYDAESSKSQRLTSVALATARQRVAQARERKGSVVNDDEAWKKIKMEQHEKDADEFRRDRLLERYWVMWRQGLIWTVDTTEQVRQARDNYILNLFVHRWRTRTVASKIRAERAAKLSNSRELRTAFAIWRAKTKEKQQIRWRASMRSKMKLIRDKRERKLLVDALEKWKRAHRTNVADQHYAGTLLIRHYSGWKMRLARLDQLNNLAAESLRVADARVLERCWDYWRRMSHLQLAYTLVADNVGLRIKTEVMDVWRKHMLDNQTADAFYNAVVKRRVLRSWKTTWDKTRTMENRAVTHITQQDRLLERAVYMVIRACYQGRRLEGMTNLRRLKEAWEVWKLQQQQQKRLEVQAISFSLRLSSPLAEESLRRWYWVYLKYKEWQLRAAEKHSKSVFRQAVLTWRIKLRDQYQEMTTARAVDRLLIMRSAWTKLRIKFAERRRESILKALEIRRTQNIFYVWFDLAHRRRAQRRAEEEIKARVIKRILRTSLTRWTNRTIDVKGRELETTIYRDGKLIQAAFKKWKDARGRHVEEVSLMESYQFVKREENIRKIFHRWLSATRATRRRRLTLERKEAEMQFSVISFAWDKWRDSFNHRRLEPIENEVILQRQRNTSSRAFNAWHSKTQSLPAIRFNASRVKARYWKIWLEALPRALEVKRFEETKRKAILTKFLEKWVQTYRTKITLKTVARARYLHLPPALPRPTPSTSRPTRFPPAAPLPAPSTSRPAPMLSRNAFPRRVVRTEEQISDGDASEEEAGPSWRYQRPTGPRSLRSDPSPPRRSRSRFSIPATRASSPTRSNVGARFGRDMPAPRPASPPRSERPREPGGFLRELRQLQRKRESVPVQLRTREPP